MAQCAAGVSVGVAIGQFSNLVLGSCWLFIVSAEDITQDVIKFNKVTKASRAKLNEIHAELTKRFGNLVQAYSDAKQ